MHCSFVRTWSVELGVFHRLENCEGVLCNNSAMSATVRPRWIEMGKVSMKSSGIVSQVFSVSSKVFNLLHSQALLYPASHQHGETQSNQQSRLSPCFAVMYANAIDSHSWGRRVVVPVIGAHRNCSVLGSSTHADRMAESSEPQTNDTQSDLLPIISSPTLIRTGDA